MTEKEKIEACNGCWYCDNIINCPDNVGLLYLGFPRCMMIIPNLKELLYNSYDDLIKVAKIEWLDPAEPRTKQEEEYVLTTLYNFSILQEQEEERLSTLFEDDF